MKNSKNIKFIISVLWLIIIFLSTIPSYGLYRGGELLSKQWSFFKIAEQYGFSRIFKGFFYNINYSLGYEGYCFFARMFIIFVVLLLVIANVLMWKNKTRLALVLSIIYALFSYKMARYFFISESGFEEYYPKVTMVGKIAYVLIALTLCLQILVFIIQIKNKDVVIDTQKITLDLFKQVAKKQAMDNVPSNNDTDELIKLKNLFDQGIITQDEYEQAKKRILRL